MKTKMTRFEHAGISRNKVSATHWRARKYAAGISCFKISATHLALTESKAGISRNKVSATYSMCCGDFTLLRKKERGHIYMAPLLSSRIKKFRTAHSRKHLTMDRISLTLPYPPSVNHYWQTRVLRRGAGYVPQVYVSGDGLRYQQAVAKHLNGVPRLSGRLRVQILVQPPDARARDLDNVLKCLLDSLTKAGVWNDDQQIDSLLVVRGETVAGGLVVVLVEEVR